MAESRKNETTDGHDKRTKRGVKGVGEGGVRQRLSECEMGTLFGCFETRERGVWRQSQDTCGTGAGTVQERCGMFRW